MNTRRMALGEPRPQRWAIVFSADPGFLEQPARALQRAGTHELSRRSARIFAERTDEAALAHGGAFRKRCDTQIAAEVLMAPIWTCWMAGRDENAPATESKTVTGRPSA